MKTQYELVGKKIYQDIAAHVGCHNSDMHKGVTNPLID